MEPSIYKIMNQFTYEFPILLPKHHQFFFIDWIIHRKANLTNIGSFYFSISNGIINCIIDVVSDILNSYRFT